MGVSSISVAASEVERAREFLKVFSDCVIVTDSASPVEELLSKTLARPDKSLRVKFGIDPTATEVHLGWMVPLLRLKKLQSLGHTVVLVIGDATATIGDPSGKSSTRKQLSREEVKKNANEVLSQIMQFLDNDKTEVRWNSSWWDKMSAVDFISMCSTVTVAQILERGDFSSRLKSGVPVGAHEALYPILQARDSVFVDCDVELGGNDQRLNCLLGRSVMSSQGMKPQTVVLTPLLVGLDGVKKMSQSLGNFISVRDSPSDIFGKVMSISDEAMDDWFDAFSLVPAFSSIHNKDKKNDLASKIVELCFNKTAACIAEMTFRETFSNRDWKLHAPEKDLSVLGEGDVSVAAMMVQLGMARTNSEARRLIREGAVEIDGSRIEDPMSFVPVGSLVGKHIKVGKRRFAKLVKDVAE